MGVLRQAAILLGMALIAGIATLLPSTGQAQTPSGNPLVTGSVVRDYARITFYWPEKIDMTATTNGNKLMVNFDRNVNPNFGELLTRLYPYVTKAELTANQRTIIFTMQKPYAIRSFITDSESGVDILGVYEDPNAPATNTTAASAAASPAAPAAAQPVVSPPAPRQKPAAPAREEATPAAPQAMTEEAPAAPEPEPAPEPVPAEPVAPAPVAETPAEAEPAAEQSIAEQPASTPEEEIIPPVEPQSTTAAPVEPVMTTTVARLQDFGAVSGENLAVELSLVNKQPHLRFPFKERVAAAVWQRGRTVMVLFNKPVTLTGLTNAEREGRSWLARAEQLGGSEFTLLRLDMVTDVYLQSFKDREGYGWQLRVSSNPTRPQETISPAINRSTGEAYIFLPVTDMGDTYRLRDPQVGDALDIIPLYASDKGISPPRGFVDVDLLATQQGIAISPKNDAVQVAQLDNGVRISMAGGLAITKDIDEAAVLAAGLRDARDELFKPSLFPNREWKVENVEEFRERETYLMQQITSAQNAYEKNQSRMALAQLYFTQERYNETLGVLNIIRRDDLDFFRDQKLAALEGAAYLLNYRIPEAALSFSSDTLDNMEEGELLRKAAAAALNRDAEPVPYMLYNDAYIRQYPPNLRQRIAIISANHAIQQGDFRNPADIFESLDEDKLSGEVADYIDYLKAKVAADAGRVQEAERIWSRLANKIEDRQFRARSEYSLVLMGLEEGTLSLEEAIRRLEALRIVWRGDDLERALLSVLGQLQVNQGNHWEGMKAWEELLQHYPNSPEALNSYQRLAENFRMLFLEDGADEMDQVKALALYNEFQELTPLGSEGNLVVQKLVDRLVGVDLLDEASARLEHQVQHRLQGEEKSRVGARLAVIHLLNRKPEEALSALQLSRVADVPASLSLERNRIAAQALIDLDRAEQALEMIEGDYSADGENVRLEAYWQKEDWAYVIDIIELMLRQRTDLNAPFTDREGQRLLQLALAYIFVAEYEQLQYLRDAYAPLMEGNPYEDEFLFLTQEQIPTNGENFSKVIEGIGAIESFMDGYRERLESGDLSETVGSSESEDETATPPANPQ